MSDTQYENLSKVLNSLPESISVISVDRAMVSVSWDEKDPEISFEVLKNHLISAANATERELHSSIAKT